MAHQKKQSAKSSKPRILKPKSEKDCPYCQAEKAQKVIPPETTYTPYSQTKSKRGRKKKTCTHHYFCSNPLCYYYLVTGERIHALIGYGSHGKHECIPDLYCQACKSKFTIRKNTLLYRLKTLSKIIPVIQLGARTQAMAYSVLHELKSRLKADCVPIFSSDGLQHYFYGLTPHFGEWKVVAGEKKPVWLILPEFMYAQVIKQQRRFRLVSVEHRLLWGNADEYRSRLKSNGLSGNINTSFVERANLTIRQSVSKLTRRTWGPAQYTLELEDHLYWWLTYYHFARYQSAL